MANTKNAGLGEALSSRPSTRAARRAQSAAIQSPLASEGSEPPVAAVERSEAAEALTPVPAPAARPAVSKPATGSRLSEKAKVDKVRVTTDIEKDVHTRLMFATETRKWSKTDVIAEALEQLLDQQGIPSAKEIEAREGR